MRLQDVLNFDAAGYATKIATYDDSRLCNNEVVKLRQKTGSAASMIGGVVMIGVTGPSCLFSIAYNARRYDIASHKRKLIRTEMTERGLAHHSLTTADVLVPVATLAINMALDTARSRYSASDYHYTHPIVNEQSATQGRDVDGHTCDSPCSRKGSRSSESGGESIESNRPRRKRRTRLRTAVRKRKSLRTCRDGRCGCITCANVFRNQDTPRFDIRNSTISRSLHRR
jgi:hypothetical protein